METPFPCPSCARLIRTRAADIGRLVACPHCRFEFPAPLPNLAPDPAAIPYAATASLVLGILSPLCTPCCPGTVPLLAIVLGHVGLGACRRTCSSHGRAVAGLVLGYGWLLLQAAAALGVYFLS